MKRKYGIGLLIVMITICAFAVTAFSQACNPTTECPCDPTATDNCGDLDDTTDGCKECSKCPIGNVPCPGQETDEQGVVTSDAVNPFDYDGEPYPADTAYANPVGFGAYGYCGTFNYAQNNFRDCKFIMDVCRCPQACDILPGSKVAIQMIIKTTGVYFAARNDGNAMKRVRFDLRGGDIAADFCDKTTTNHPEKVNMGTGTYYLDAEGNPVASQNMAQDIVNQVRHFPNVAFYRNYTEYYDGNGKFRSEVSNVGTPLGGAQINSIADVNKVVALESVGEYMFNDNDAAVVGGNSECHIWVDIPPMRINPGEYTAGDTVKVTVRLVFNREAPGICPTCNAPDYCECEREVAILCCDEVADEKCMLFPYVLQNLTPWWSGVAITAREDELAADAYLKLTAKDQNGNIGTYMVTSVKPIWTSVLDDILPNFTMTQGTAFTGGALSLKVESNYSMLGYSFLTDGNFGAGTLASGCAAGNCCP